MLRTAGMKIGSAIVTAVEETAAISLSVYQFIGDPKNAGNILFLMFDFISVGIPNFAKAANAAKNFRAVHGFGGLSPAGTARAQIIDRVIEREFAFH